MQNLYQLVKYSLIKQPELDTCYDLSNITIHSNITLLTVEDQLLIKNEQTEKS